MMPQVAGGRAGAVTEAIEVLMIRRLGYRGIAHSADVADALAGRCRIPPSRVARIPLGIDTGTLAGASLDGAGERWRSQHGIAPDAPVHGVPFAAIEARRTEGSGRAEVRAGLGVDDSTVLAVTIANLRYHKDYPTLLEAARLVAATCSKVRFAAVGQGPLAGELAARATAMGLDGTFSFVGYQADPLAWLAAADLFVLPSLDEGYPVALMEALAMGVPVVATAVGGVIDAVGPLVDGVLVPPGNPPALADAITILAADKEARRRMATAAVAGAARYDIVRATARMEEVYAKVSMRPRARAGSRWTNRAAR